MKMFVSDSIRVPPINRRERISQAAIDAVVRQIVTKFQPERIILFGSYAYGQPHPESDVDLLVIMHTPQKEIDQAIQICQAIDYHFGLDLIVRKPEVLEKRLKLGDFFLREIVNRGKILYERTHH